MEWNTMLMLVGGAVALVGAVCFCYQLYQIVKTDAKSRGLKYPKFWGGFSISGNNSSGLILYLIGRRKYPVIHLSDMEKEQILRRKKAVGAALSFLSAGAVIFVLGISEIL